ncbi:MAG: helix-turn-helix transcriptional regulator, partial [Proteiniphilum sp.]|nr:helix-turn-helix transcriptional regulator [Proteiniphilum sp.]
LDFLRHVTDIIYREMKNPEFSPKKLADELAISLSQLNKKLNATTGFPSSTYILQVKLAHAKKILSFQNKTIGEVATECGIYDVNYFSRIFKKQTGITPSQYKRLPVSN